MNIQEIISSLRFIANADNPDREIGKHIQKLERYFGSAGFMDLLFWPDRPMKIEEVAERAIELKRTGGSYTPPKSPPAWWANHDPSLD
jgi:hypothetical protein